MHYKLLEKMDATTPWSEQKGQIKSFLGDISVDESTDERRISGYASRPLPDRVGEVVETKAFNKSIRSFMEDNPVMLFMHQMDQPIGTWDRFEIRNDGLFVSGTLIPSGLPDADKVWTLAKHRAIRGLSIGFLPLEGELDKKSGYFHITDLELLEISPVTIPAQRNALFSIDGSGKLLGVEMLQDSRSIREEKIMEQNLKELEDAVKEIREQVSPVADLMKRVDEIQKFVDTVTHANAEVAKIKELSEMLNFRLENIESGFKSYLMTQIEDAIGEMDTDVEGTSDDEDSE